MGIRGRLSVGGKESSVCGCKMLCGTFLHLLLCCAYRLATILLRSSLIFVPVRSLRTEASHRFLSSIQSLSFCHIPQEKHHTIGMSTTALFRGRGGDSVSTRRIGKRGGQFESLRPLADQQPGDVAKSIEGWVLFITGLPSETTEGDLVDAFAAFGTIRNIRVNVDQRDMKCIGHAMLEYEQAEECERAIAALSGQPFLSSSSMCISPAFIVEEETDDGDNVNRKRAERESE